MIPLRGQNPQVCDLLVVTVAIPKLKFGTQSIVMMFQTTDLITTVGIQYNEHLIQNRKLTHLFGIVLLVHMISDLKLLFHPMQKETWIVGRTMPL